MDKRKKKILGLFGKSSLKEAQREMIAHALAGENTLGILPTGYGKSLCYQAAATLTEGMSLVVSPLIALMREQVQTLQKQGIAAKRFDSSLPETEKKLLLQQVERGEIKLLFAAPESLEHSALQRALLSIRLSLFVIDEAHCLSAWGHSFRPDYLKLPAWFRAKDFRSVMALTATAAPRVRRDLCEAFGIADGCVVARSPYRPNIERMVSCATDREAALAEFLSQPEHTPAIIYTRTRKAAEELAGRLSASGHAALCYHAGQTPALREKLQDMFLSNQCRILVATIAFGMGIDKPDVRTVIHFNAPESPENYLQESGRAGRDGQPAASLVFLHGDDILEAENRIYAAEPDPEGVLACAGQMMAAGSRTVNLRRLCVFCDVPEEVPWRILQQGMDEGILLQEGRGYEHYKAKPLFPLQIILSGRDGVETARLQWLASHPEQSVEEAADAWDCSWEEAFQQLEECKASGEWNVMFRHYALRLRTRTRGMAEEVATRLSDTYARKRESDLFRLKETVRILTSTSCINAALETYLTERPCRPCGHCAACRGMVPAAIPRPAPPTPLPSPGDLPHFERESQMKRFLMGYSTPRLRERMLHAHPLYGSVSGMPWLSFPDLRR